MGGVQRKWEGKGDRLGVWVNFAREPVNSMGATGDERLGVWEDLGRAREGGRPSGGDKFRMRGLKSVG